MQALSELISKPTQTRKKKAPAPTSGERGQALATQKVSYRHLYILSLIRILQRKRNAKAKATADPPIMGSANIPTFVPLPYVSAPVSESSQGRSLL